MIPHKTRIRRIRSIEAKAQKLQAQLDQLQTEWEENLDIVQRSTEWKDDCDKRGLITNPTWGGVIC